MILALDLFSNFFLPWTRPALEMYWAVLVEGALVSVALGLIGCFLVVRGLSLLGDALSHSVLPGIVIGFLIGGSLHSPWILVGATAMGLLAGLLIQSVHSHSRVKEDASLGIVFTTLFALGVVMINRYAGQADLDPACVLYGNLEFFVLQPDAVWPMVGILGGIIVLLLLFYRYLLVSTFDPSLAISLGIPATAVHYGMMALLSLTVVTSFEAVGAILAVALLIMPGATARLWTDRMPRMLLLATGLAVVSTLGGYWLATWLDKPISGTMTIAGFALFLASWLFAPHTGLVVRAIHRRRLAQRILADHVLTSLEELGAGREQAGMAEPELAAALRVESKPLAGAIARGLAAGWLRRDDGRVVLTEAGQRQSRRLARAHVLWEQYLQQQVGLPADHVHDAADWIEHHLNDAELDRLDDALKESRPAGGG